MAWRTKIGSLIMALMILPFSMMSVQAQMLVQEQLASKFAETHEFEKNIQDAILKAEEKFAEAAKENKSANIIQCGTSTCDLDTNVCVKKFVFRGETTWSCKDKNYELVTDKVESEDDYTTESYCYKDCFKKEGFLTKGEYITATDAEGNKYRVYIGSNAISIQYDSSQKKIKGFRGCEVLPVKLHNYKKCFFCHLLGVIYDGSARLVDHSFPALAKSFVALLVVGMSIWIAIQVLGQISSLTKQDAQKFLGALIKQSYKFLIAVFLLLNSQQIFDYGIRPLTQAGLTFGKEMLKTKDAFDATQHQRIAHGAPGGKYLTVVMYDQLEQYVVAIQQKISFMQAVGSSLWCIGGNYLVGKGQNKLIKDMGDGIEMMAQGAVIAIFGFLLSIAFIFYLIDAVVQLGLTAALSPFLIVAWPFKATAKYTKTGINMFLNSVFVFIFVGLVISINFELINQALNPTSGGGGLVLIAEAINSQDLDKLVQYTEITAVGFMFLIFCCIFGFKFTNQASSLASKFAGGFMTAGKKAFAPNIATMGASTAKGLALGVTKNTRKSIDRRIDKAGTAIATFLPYTVPKAIINYARKKSQESKTPVANPKNVTTPSVRNSGARSQDERSATTEPVTHNKNAGTGSMKNKIAAAQKPKAAKTTFKTNKMIQTNTRTKKGSSAKNRKRKGRRK